MSRYYNFTIVLSEHWGTELPMTPQDLHDAIRLAFPLVSHDGEAVAVLEWNPNQPSRILDSLEELPEGAGFSCYHQEDGAAWAVAYKDMRFLGETLTEALGQLTTYLENKE